MTPRAIADWFRSAWRDKGRRHAAIIAYERLRDPLLIADIALRGGVFAPPEPVAPGQPLDTVALAFAAGRRSLAIELMQLAALPTHVLLAIVFEPAKPEKTP